MRYFALFVKGIYFFLRGSRMKGILQKYGDISLLRWRRCRALSVTDEESKRFAVFVHIKRELQMHCYDFIRYKNARQYLLITRLGGSFSKGEAKQIFSCVSPVFFSVAADFTFYSAKIAKQFFAPLPR